MKSLIKFDKKAFIKRLELITDSLFEKSVIFFSIDIDISTYWEDLDIVPKNYTKKETQDFLIKYAWEEVPVFVEDFKKQFQKIELMEFLYICIEKEKDDINNPSYGFPQIKILCCMKTLIGYNPGVLIKLKEAFYELYLDANINYLDDSYKVKTYWNSFYKNINEYEDSQLFSTHFFFLFSYTSEMYGEFTDFVDYANKDLPFGEFTVLKHKHAKFPYSKLKIQNELILIRLWNMFFQINDIVVSVGVGNVILQKNINSKYTYEIIGELKILKDLRNKILVYLAKHFPLQMEYVNQDNLMVMYFEKAIHMINILPELLRTKKVNFNLIEFQNGIYNVKYDCFLSYEDSKYKEWQKEDVEEKEEILCYKYYNIKYKKASKPKYWLSKIKKEIEKEREIEKEVAMEGKEVEVEVEVEVGEFCKYFGQIIHNNTIYLDRKKKRSLVSDNNRKNTVRYPKEKEKDIIEIASDIDIDINLSRDISENENENENVNEIPRNYKYDNIIKKNELEYEIDERLKKEEHKIIMYCNGIYVKKYLKKKNKLKCYEILKVKY